MTTFSRGDSYKETYLRRVLPYQPVKNKFRDFMETKRNDPQQAFGANDKLFKTNGNFGSVIPGLRHAHITGDLSIVYLITGDIISLYGFFTHDELGTGQPPNMNRQRSSAAKFSHEKFI